MTILEPALVIVWRCLAPGQSHHVVAGLWRTSARERSSPCSDAASGVVQVGVEVLACLVDVLLEGSLRSVVPGSGHPQVAFPDGGAVAETHVPRII